MVKLNKDIRVKTKYKTVIMFRDHQKVFNTFKPSHERLGNKSNKFHGNRTMTIKKVKTSQSKVNMVNCKIIWYINILLFMCFLLVKSVSTTQNSLCWLYWSFYVILIELFTLWTIYNYMVTLAWPFTNIIVIKTHLFKTYLMSSHVNKALS